MNVTLGGRPADPAAARRQMEASFHRLGKRPIDLIQVHNLADPTQLDILKELKQNGQIRYIGVTTTYPQQYDELQRIMRTEPLDFIGIDYGAWRSTWTLCSRRGTLSCCSTPPAG